MYPARSRLFLLLIVAAACAPTMAPPSSGTADAGPAAKPTQPPGWADSVRLQEATDLDPSPRVFETNVEAKVVDVEIVPGKTTSVWTYNGTLPGPLIRVRVGDRLIVHFKNSLPEQTTIHWHGLRIPVDQDGVVGHSQTAVRPGGTFEYSFVVPDAGLYWFHPHFDTAAQQGDGLYGTILVEDPNEPKGFGEPLVLQLSDIGLDAKTGELNPHDIGGDIATLFGREGDTLLVNGKVLPTLQARAGLRQRWRVVNSAKSRYFQLVLDGHKFLRIGGDRGLIETPIEVEQPILVPGERADFLIVPTGAPGGTATLQWKASERGYGSTFMRKNVALMNIAFTDEPPVPESSLPPVPATGVHVEPLALEGATPVKIAFTRNDVVDDNGKSKEFRLGVNNRYFGEGEMFFARIGETQIWTIENTIEFSHPFHLHGFFFQRLDQQGVPIAEWKDTVDLPTAERVGDQTKNTQIKIAVRFEDRPGMWMFHCHILDHSDAGMGAMLDVTPN